MISYFFFSASGQVWPSIDHSPATNVSTMCLARDSIHLKFVFLSVKSQTNFWTDLAATPLWPTWADPRMTDRLIPQQLECQSIQTEGILCSIYSCSLSLIERESCIIQEQTGPLGCQWNVMSRLFWVTQISLRPGRQFYFELIIKLKSGML